MTTMKAGRSAKTWRIAALVWAIIPQTRSAQAARGSPVTPGAHRGCAVDRPASTPLRTRLRDHKSRAPNAALGDRCKHARTRRRVQRLIFGPPFLRPQLITRAHPLHGDFLSSGAARRARSALSVDAPEAAFDGQPFDPLEIPGYAESWRIAGLGITLVNRHLLRGDIAELRDIFEPARVGNGAA
jgi:hypothetical protein